MIMNTHQKPSTMRAAWDIGWRSVPGKVGGKLIGLSLDWLIDWRFMSVGKVSLENNIIACGLRDRRIEN